MLGRSTAVQRFSHWLLEITGTLSRSLAASLTRRRIAASPKTIGTHCRAIAASAKRCKQTSGPTPAGSPIVTAIRGSGAMSLLIWLQGGGKKAGHMLQLLRRVKQLAA